MKDHKEANKHHGVHAGINPNRVWHQGNSMIDHGVRQFLRGINGKLITEIVAKHGYHCDHSEVEHFILVSDLESQTCFFSAP